MPTLYLENPSGSFVVKLSTEDNELARQISRYALFESDKKPSHTFLFKRRSNFSLLLRFKKIKIYQNFYFKSHANSTVVYTPKKFDDWEIDKFLQIYYSSRIIYKGEILLHGSAIIKNGGIVMFLGKSGAGKSTISRLSGLKVIHDDLVSIKPETDGSFTISSIPFKTPFEKKVFKGQIIGIYAIHKSKENSRYKISYSSQLMKAIYAIWTFDLFENGSTDNERYIKVLEKILLKCEIEDLHFDYSNDFVKLI